MTTKTIDCVECGESVSYGRLSCPACGALLASVAGARPRTPRKSRAATSGEGPATPAGNAAATDTHTAPTAGGVWTLADPTAVDVAPNQIELPLDGPVEGLEAEPEAAEPESKLAQPAAEGPAAAEPDAARAELAEAPEVSQLAPDLDELTLEPAAFALSPEPGAALPAPVRTPFDGPEPVLVARPYGHWVDMTGGAASGRPPASAYRPPTLALSTATAAGPTWPATTMTVAARSSIAATDPADAEPADAAAEQGQATRFVEIGTWFVIVGAAMSVLGFLLPWSRVVIGSRSLGGYLDTWGLASPTHVMVLLATLGILGLGIMRTTIPVWLWAGVLALALGGVLIGLTWPYQFGPLGADVGVIVVALGGLALVIGGVVTSWATRHVEVEPAV